MIEKALESGRSAPLQNVIQYSLEAGGKRIRPVLTLAFCEAYGGDAESALPVAAAIELLHTSTLIQDDLPCMDDDDERRGKPACHKAFSESDAILAASAMAYEALGMIDDIRIVKAICNYMRDIYSGQKSDLDYSGSAPDKAKVLEIYTLKTCALIQAACTAGVLAANGDEAAVKNAERFAYYLGLAFQLVDDKLDGEAYEGAEEDAARFTQEALSLLANVPDNEFITELTKSLLIRSS
jgi:geranylgeranyl diphosphate synthase type II